MIGLNQLRTAYVQAPPSVRRLLSPILSAIPLRYRFGGTYVDYRTKIDRSRRDLDFVSAWRRDRLRAIIGVATTRSPHYRRIAKCIGFDQSSIASFEVPDLAGFPILTKEELRGDCEDFLTCAKDKLDEVSTSGSSGTPLIIYLDKDRSAKEWAFVQDSWSKIGFEPRCIRAVFRGIHLDNVDKTPWEFEPALGELRLSPFHLTDAWMEKYCDLIQRYRASFLHGLPSAIFIFANYVLRAGRKDVADRISGIITSSEALFAHQRERMSHAFPKAKITSYYGMSEKVLFGSEVPDRSGVFEMEPLYGIAELVDDHGRTVEEPGKKGRIIGTGLLYRGMPLIRYDTNDIAELVESASEQNYYRIKVKNITSHWGQEFLVGIDGQLISMTAIDIRSPVYSKMSTFQFHQTKPGNATLMTVLAPGCSEEDIAPFIDEISAKIGSSLVFDIKIVDNIPRNLRGKSKFVDQKIDLSFFGHTDPDN